MLFTRFSFLLSYLLAILVANVEKLEKYEIEILDEMPVSMMMQPEHNGIYSRYKGSDLDSFYLLQIESQIDSITSLDFEARVCYAATVTAI